MTESKLLSSSKHRPVWLYSYHVGWKTMLVSPCWVYLGDEHSELVFVEYYTRRSDRSKRTSRTRVSKHEGYILEANGGRISAWSSSRKDSEFLEYFTEFRLAKIDDLLGAIAKKKQKLEEERERLLNDDFSLEEVI